MTDVQVFEGDGRNPDNDFVSIPWGGFSVHANRKGSLTYHIFPRGHTGSIVLPRSEFVRRTGLSDEMIVRVEYGALAMRRFLTDQRKKFGDGLLPDSIWTVEDKMKERVL